jgi:ElaB/YqjD/DUF883 family membrane-anchored ribosome-binding protein
MMTESTVNDAARALGEDARALRDAARAAAHRAHIAGNAEVEKLILDVEDLVRQLADSVDPRIARLRARVTDTVRATRRAISDGAGQVQRQARDALSVGDSYVHEQPWQAVGAAALVGLIAALVLFRR